MLLFLRPLLPMKVHSELFVLQPEDVGLVPCHERILLVQTGDVFFRSVSVAASRMVGLVLRLLLLLQYTSDGIVPTLGSDLSSTVVDLVFQSAGAALGFPLLLLRRGKAKQSVPPSPAVPVVNPVVLPLLTIVLAVPRAVNAKGCVIVPVVPRVAGVLFRRSVKLVQRCLVGPRNGFDGPAWLTFDDFPRQAYYTVGVGLGLAIGPPPVGAVGAARAFCRFGVIPVDGTALLWAGW